MNKIGIHRASSQTWGDSACARLCGIIVESNTGVSQQIIQNRTDLFDLCSLAELQQPDDLGLKIQFLAIYHDQPDILIYLKSRGIDLSLPCDSMNFANPMFYALQLGKHRLIRLLDLLGCSVNNPCNEFNDKPVDLAQRLNDHIALHEIMMSQTKELRAALLFRKNYLRVKNRRLYKNSIDMIVRIQKIFRGIIGRRRAQKQMEELRKEKLLEGDDEPMKKMKKKKNK